MLEAARALALTVARAGALARGPRGGGARGRGTLIRLRFPGLPA